MEKKVVFLDIDGTLVDQEKQIPQSTKEAVKALQEKGVHVVIATGRPPFMYEHIRSQLNIDSYISFSGQHVVLKGETIFKNPIHHEKIKKMHDVAKKKQYPMIFMSESKMRATVADHHYVKKGLARLQFDYPKVDVDFPKRNTIYQALLFCKTTVEEKLKENHQAFTFLRWHPYACDILPSGGSKALGVQQILNSLNIKRENAYAIGDGFNDLEMFQEVGTGIAMGNAVQPLKEIADHVTASVEEDGLAKALEIYQLI